MSETVLASMHSIVKRGCGIARLTKSIEAKQSRDIFETVKPAEEVKQASSAWMEAGREFPVAGSTWGGQGPPAVVRSSDECRQ